MHHMYIVAICTGAINVLTNKGMFNRDLNPLYKPMADDATADAIIKLIASDIAVDIAENTAQPKLVYCPRLSVSMKGVGTHTLPVSVPPAGELGKLYTKAYGNKQHQYHMDVAEMFSLVVNSGTAQDYNDAATRCDVGCDNVSHHA